MYSWTNFHSHTHYCDGSSPVEEYVKAAINLDMPAYGFSSHAPVAFPTDWCIPDDDMENYLSDFDRVKKKYSDKIQLYCGLEIDYIPGIAGRNKHLLHSIDLDYFIGSIHFVNAFPDGTPWNIDTAFELFQKGLAEIFNNSIEKAAQCFFELTREMIVSEKPDIIGHIDKIKMFNNRGNYFDESEKWYRDQIQETISVLKHHNSIVEVNTRGFYRYGQPDLYPSLWIVEQLNAADIPLMINSDSHKPEEINAGMTYAATELMKVGVKELYSLSDGKWRSHKFTAEGLLFK